MDIPRLGKPFGVRGARAIHKSAPYSIRRALERTSLMAVMLGYGLLLLFTVQLSSLLNSAGKAKYKPLNMPKQSLESRRIRFLILILHQYLDQVLILYCLREC